MQHMVPYGAVAHMRITQALPGCSIKFRHKPCFVVASSDLRPSPMTPLPRSRGFSQQLHVVIDTDRHCLYRERSHRKPANSVRKCLPPCSCTGVTPSATVTSWRHALPDGASLEVLTQRPSVETTQPPLVFVHGLGHAAWCWQENFFAFFSDAGYTCHAVSLRGQGEGDEDSGIMCGGTLESHAHDLSHVIQSLDQQPVLVGHSLGGLVAMKYLSLLPEDLPRLRGLAFLCSVPPKGTFRLMVHLMMTTPLMGCKVLWCLYTRATMRSLSACREMFFTEHLPHDKLQQYFLQHQAMSNKAVLVNMLALPFESPIPPPPPDCPPVFVGGGTRDVMMDPVSLNATADHYGVEACLMDELAHDCMLDANWQSMATELRNFLESI